MRSRAATTGLFGLGYFRTQLWDLRTGCALSDVDNNVDSAAWSGPHDVAAVAAGFSTRCS